LVRVAFSALQLGLVVAIVALYRTEAPASFSVHFWLVVLVPPLIFGALFLMARARPAHVAGWKRVMIRTADGLNLVCLVLTVAAVPIMVLGEATIEGIG
jgi:hypothetical protein